MQADNTILVVDDDETTHYLADRALRRLAFDGEIVSVFDGTEACQWLRDHGCPLLMLLDLRMPLMDGHEVLEQMATGELGDAPPVCIVSSSGRPEDLQLGNRYEFVEAYLEKPPDAASLWSATATKDDIRARFTAPQTA